MTDNQKVILAVLGSVVGHLLLFLSMGVLLAVSNLITPPRAHAAAEPNREPEPEEVTILLSELLDQIDLTPKEQTQQFARTDPDQESAIKPENAPFHAERNTLAASELAPDPSSDLPMPTVKARDDLPFFEIRDRNYVDGEFNDASAASAPSTPSPPSMPSTPSLVLSQENPDQSEGESKEKPDTPSETKLENEADPADQPKEAPDANPEKPDEAEEVPEDAADMLIQPDSQNPEAARLAAAQESFTDPQAANTLPLPDNPAPKDEEAAAMRPSKEIGQPAEPETPKPASAMPKLKQYLPQTTPQMAQTPPSDPQAASADIPPTPKPPADDTAFTPETAARSVNGTISNRGKAPALDVEATELGRYKKAVTQAVERQWHRYRERNADFVTYGTLRVSFRVGKDGRARNLKLVKNEANAVMAEFTLRAILDAKLPEMPPNVASQIGNSLDFSYNVIIY